MATLVNAEIREFMEAEIQTSGGYTDNLQTAKVYPLPMVEVLLNGEYTNYGNIINLGNIMGGGGITIIPLNTTSPFSIYLNGNINSRSYRNDYKSYNTNIIDGMATLGYVFSPTLQIRTGFSIRSTSYPNMKTFDIDNTNYEIFGGGNLSFLGSNSLDLEIGYAFMNLTYWEKEKWIDKLDIPSGDTIYFIDPDNNEYKPPTVGQLTSIYISPRYSRPIGDKIAFTITYSYRKFGDLGEIAVAGVSTQSLSPWASVFEGESISLKIKSYLLPNYIFSSGIGYWKKDYLKTNENRETLPRYIIKGRHDEQNKAFLSIKRPFPLKSGLFIEPSLQINYTKNNSSNPQYDYDNYSISGGVTIRY
jgi:hypothetical protein